MKLKLTIDVPASANQTAALQQLLGAGLNRHGITIVTGNGYHMDVDLVDVERGDS